MPQRIASSIFPKLSKLKSKSFVLLVPDNLKLYDFQREDAEFFVANGGGFLQHQMGVGKSIIATVAANTLKAGCWLIVAPAIMRRTWEKEFEKWSVRKWNVEVIDTDTKADKFGRRLPNIRTDCLIVSYNYISDKRNITYLLKEYDYDGLICDEWHYCKSLKSKRTKYALLLARKPKHFLALTGTPYTKNVMDLYSQLIPFADEKEIGKSYVEFGYKFSYLVDNGFGRYFEGLRNEEELIRIQRRFARRRLKKDVLKELPPLTLTNIYIDIPKSIAKESLKYVDVAMQEITGQKHYVDPDLKDHVATMKRQLGLSKCRAAVEYILYLAETIPHLVVFAYHKDVIAVIKEALRKHKLKVRSITGATPSKKRDAYIRGFQRGKYNVLLAQVSAGGVGITLTRASRGVLCELDWSAATLEQAFSRLHRITQSSAVQFDILVARNSLDQEIVASLKKKIRLSKKALGDS